MQFVYKSEDGEIESTKLDSFCDLPTIRLGTPHKGSTCSFRIISVQKISTEEKAAKFPTAPSTYLSSANNAETLSAIIGVTSTSDFDRLLEICLTRLHVGQTASFRIICYRSGSSYNVTIELVQIQGNFEGLRLRLSCNLFLSLLFLIFRVC